MTARLFTFVCEFRGGTYVSQVFARDDRDAVAAWAENLRLERPFKRASVFIAKSVLADLADSSPVAISGVSGVWCITGTCGRDFMLANIVETAAPPGLDAPND